MLKISIQIPSLKGLKGVSLWFLVKDLEGTKVKKTFEMNRKIMEDPSTTAQIKRRTRSLSLPPFSRLGDEVGTSWWVKPGAKSSKSSSHALIQPELSCRPVVRGRRVFVGPELVFKVLRLVDPKNSRV